MVRLDQTVLSLHGRPIMRQKKEKLLPAQARYLLYESAALRKRSAQLLGYAREYLWFLVVYFLLACILITLTILFGAQCYADGTFLYFSFSFECAMMAILLALLLTESIRRRNMYKRDAKLYAKCAQDMTQELTTKHA